MTIAACYVSDEGVVLGADSTTTYNLTDKIVHLNNAQKVFEIGEMGSTLGLVTWGLGGLPGMSFRQLAAEISDDFLVSPPGTVRAAAERWGAKFWTEYSTRLTAERASFQQLLAKPDRTGDEQRQLQDQYQRLFVGFCIGGHVKESRRPEAFSVLFALDLSTAPAPGEVNRYRPIFWGVPNLINRLLFGIDEQVLNRIKESGHWSGTEADLVSVITPSVLSMPVQVPLRDAIDWIYSSIFITIKALKFSANPPICGGPIEVAVISADRRFRWVCHKGLDQALTDHSARGVY